MENVKRNLGILALAASSSCASVSAPVDTKIYSFESDGNGFNTKNYFIDTGREIVVVDTQFTNELAQKSIDFIRSKSTSPITHVILTHPNPDKFNGMKVFQKLGAKVIASRQSAESLEGVHAYKKHFFVNIAKMFTEATYPSLGKVDVVFDERLTLELAGGERILVRELSKPGVSSNQSVVYVPSQKSLIVGDLVHSKAHAWLEGGIVNGKATPTIRSWIESLESLKGFYPHSTTVLGGRGESAQLEPAVDEQVAYLKKADEIVSNYVKGLGIQKNELSGEKAAEHFRALTQIFEKQFPTYALSYMIQYGVYGLALSK